MNTKVSKRGAALPHNPRTPFQMESSDCGPTAAPRPYLYEHRQARPGVAQAVLHVFLFVQATRKWSRLKGSVQPQASPFSTQIPDHAVPRTLSQPSCCLILSPGPSVTERERVRNSSVDRRCHRPPCAFLVFGKDPIRRSGLEPTTSPRTWPAVHR